MITPVPDVCRPTLPTCPSAHRPFPGCPGTARPPAVRCHHEWTQGPWILGAFLWWKVVASNEMVRKAWKVWIVWKLWDDEMKIEVCERVRMRRP